MSCNVSCVFAPIAGESLFTATDVFTKLTIPALFVVLTSSLNSIKSICVNLLETTLSDIPFPNEYVTVKVVLAGAWPYVLVYKKFDGSISTSKFLLNPAKPLPTLSGLGTISSSLLIVAAFFQIFDGLQAAGLGILRGLTDVKIPLVIVFSCYWLFAIPMGYLMAFKFGLGAVGIWIGLAIGLATVAFFLIIRFNIRSKSSKNIYHD